MSTSERRPPPSSPAVSRNMRANRSESDIERRLRGALHREGLRFRKHVTVVPGLRARPDIAFPRPRVAVFVDGCFWHRCPMHGTDPRAHEEWWRTKLDETSSGPPARRSAARGRLDSAAPVGAREAGRDGREGVRRGCGGSLPGGGEAACRDPDRAPRRTPRPRTLTRWSRSLALLPARQTCAPIGAETRSLSWCCDRWCTREACGSESTSLCASMGTRGRSGRT